MWSQSDKPFSRYRIHKQTDGRMYGQGHSIIFRRAYKNEREMTKVHLIKWYKDEWVLISLFGMTI